MTPEALKELILENVPFVPNVEQMGLIHSLADFVVNREPTDVFLLNGYAGTGKTSIIGALVKALERLKMKTTVLAPTGRAAKVAASLSFGKASTIHKKLYRGNSADPSNSTYFLAENRDKDTLFIIDEASLITDGNNISNSLLIQLFRFVYSGTGCTMILVGDMAQLPPVGQTHSHAMNPERIRQIGFNPVTYSLTEPARQASESGILYNATIVRKSLFSDFPIENFTIFQSGFPDIEVLSPSDFLDSLAASYANAGKDETIVITRSNFRANNINATIRRYIMDAEGPLVAGERLVISKNDYFWSKENKLENFLANGEIAEVVGSGKKTKAYGRWFADVDLKIPGIENSVAAKIILRSLVAEGPAIPREEMERFYARVLAAAEGELSEKIKFAISNPYYNALQVKYGYCVTCHKAQGGQWKHVYIDMGGISQDAEPSDFYRWLYTAITRATEKIFFLNPSFEVE
ncbi:MAG: AAA family ATPase [Muribaculaceae bacterium]|nr:AAA family ATPase [Muribaculaceae bacterium]